MRRLLLPLVAAASFAACEDDRVGELQPIVDVNPKHLDFGVVELSQEQRLATTLSNQQVVAAALSYDLVDDCEPDCFLLIDPPSELVGPASAELTVRFRATRVEIATGTVTITTNDPKAPVRTVTLVGRGSDNCHPGVEVQPEVVDFGFVPAGGIAVSSFVVRSNGCNDLLIDRVRIDPPGAPFRITTATPSPDRPGLLAPGSQASVGLRAVVPETVSGTVTAQVIIETNVLEEKNVPGKVGWVAVPLNARANLPPLAIVGEDQTVDPWSRVTLDGGKSHDQDDPPDHPLTFRWEILQKPDGSTTELERARTETPSFWVDLTGRYEIGLVVTDALGLESQNRAVTVVEALPTNAVRIELIWDHPDADLDLHLIREGGAFCDCASDVHYRDCGREPIWFPQAPGANPRLDVDDRSGFGPENINIDGDGPTRYIPPGAYTIAAHYYSSNSGVSTWPTTTANATIRVYVYGLLAAQLSQALQTDGDLWMAGTLHWPEHRVDANGQLLGGQTCAAF